MNRRSFVSRISSFALLAFTAGTSVFMTGCSALTDLKNWIPVGLAALSGILKVLNVTSNPIVTLIQAGFSALLTAITNYQSGSGVLVDVTNAITDIETNFQTFFANLNVPQTLLNTIEGLANVILSTISAFAAQIASTPAPAPAPVAATNVRVLASTVKISGRTIPYSPKRRSIHQFKSDWNSVCVGNGHPEIQLK